MAIAQLTSRLDRVKVYATGSMVTRLVELPGLEMPTGEGAIEVELVDLPLAMDDSTVRVRVEATTAAPPSVLVTDVRVRLAVPVRSVGATSALDDAVRSAQAEVDRLRYLDGLIAQEIALLQQLAIPERPEGELGKAPPPSPLSTRLAIATFKDGQIRDRLQERRDLARALHLAQEQLDERLQQQSLATSAREAREHELRKTVIVRLSSSLVNPSLGTAQYPRTPTVLMNPSPVLVTLALDYFILGARWVPTYLCRLDSQTNQATIALRALICQRTGEDWTGVHLELSTATPTAWCELPELPAIRLGRAQSLPVKRGWRPPPLGAADLFTDFDRQRQAAPPPRDRSGVPSLPELQPPLAMTPSFYPESASYIETLADAMPPRPGSASEAYFEYQAEDENIFRSDHPAPVLSSPPSSKRLSTIGGSRRANPPAMRSRPQGMAQNEAHGEASGPKSRPTVSAIDPYAYSRLRLARADDAQQRGQLQIETLDSIYKASLERQGVTVPFNLMTALQAAVETAQTCQTLPLPMGGVDVREMAGAFDYAYLAEGVADIPSDGQFHSIALTSAQTDVSLRYVVVPREDTHVFRIAQLKNPFSAPLLAGAADIYADGEYIVSTTIATIPPRGDLSLGLGVEQGIKVARNTAYQERRSGETLVAFTELCHRIDITIANRLQQLAVIDVRERVPVPHPNAKVDVVVNRSEPQWSPYAQQDQEFPIAGGYHWQVTVPAQEEMALMAEYTIKIFVDNEVIGGNRRD